MILKNKTKVLLKWNCQQREAEAACGMWGTGRKSLVLGHHAEMSPWLSSAPLQARSSRISASLLSADSRPLKSGSLPNHLTLCFGTRGSQLCLAGQWDLHRVSVAHCSVTFAILCHSFREAELHKSLPPTVPQDKPHVFSLGIFKPTFEFSHSSVFWARQHLTPLIPL